MSGRQPRVLVGGPIQRLFGREGFEPAERARITAIHQALSADGIEVLSAHVTESFDRVACTSREIATRDHRWAHECDLYLGILPMGEDGWPIPSWGTAIELGWVSSRRMPVVIAWNTASAFRFSHLVRGLDAVTRVRFVDLDVPPDALAQVVRDELTKAEEGASDGAALSSIAGGERF